MSEQERLSELRRFLKARRERVTPADVGLPTTGRRRVRGLRREEVASLAGIGVSWYTALENGEALGVSEDTLVAVADALRLSPSERQYLFSLAGRAEETREFVPPDPLVIDTMRALAFPAYIISSTWDVLDYNKAFARVWGIENEAPPFNAIERLFLHPIARKMHGNRFEENIRPVIAMFRSSQGRQTHLRRMLDVRNILLTDDVVKRVWDEYEVTSPLLPVTVTIDSAIGAFTYRTLTLPIETTLHGIVVQVPDEHSRSLLTSAVLEW